MSLHRLRASRRHRAGARGDIVAARHRRGGRRAPSPPRAVRPGRGIAVVAVRQHPSRGRGLARDVGAEGVGAARGVQPRRISRRAVLRAWTEQRDALFPALTERYPELFPEQHFRTSRWVWAMSTVWSRAAHVPAGNGRTLLAMVPLFDMFNHGYGRGDGSSSPAAIETRWDPTSGAIVVRSTYGFPGRDTRRGSTTAINPRSTRSCSTVSCR